MLEPDLAWLTVGISTPTSYPHAPYARAMNRLRQYALPRQHGRSRRDLHTRNRRPATKHLIAAATVALAVFPLSACSNGGGSIIRSWLLKQDGVEKVKMTHSKCTFLDGEEECSTAATIDLSPNTTPDAICSLAQKADDELPKKKHIDSHSASLTFTWKYRGTKMTLENHDTPIADTANTGNNVPQDCEMLSIAAEYAGEGVDEITASSQKLEIRRGDVDKVPDNLFTRTPSPGKELRTESWDNFTLNDWDATVTASSATSAPEPATKKMLTEISQTSVPSDRSKLLIFLQLGGYQGESSESDITVGGLGGNSIAGPDTDAAAQVLAITMKYPEISKISLCPSSKSSMDSCIVYTKENGAIDTNSDYFTGRTREIYDTAKELS